MSFKDIKIVDFNQNFISKLLDFISKPILIHEKHIFLLLILNSEVWHGVAVKNIKIFKGNNIKSLW